MNSEKAVAIYSRKSKFTGKGESIENQIELCRQYIITNTDGGKTAPIIIYEDEGFSGRNMERPQFKKMMSDAERGMIFSIVVYRLDRISRNISDFALLIEKLNDMKISFISIKEQFDTSSPMGRAMMYIASVFSQLERETIAERIRDNMQELSKTGRWLGGTTPTGYSSEQIQRVSIDGKVHKLCKLKVIPEEVKLVKIIFDKFMETNSLTKTDAFLLQHGYTTKNNKQFTRFSIRGILSNPVYMRADKSAYSYMIRNGAEIFAEKEKFDGVHGIMVYNRTLQRPGKSVKVRSMAEWIVSVGEHDGIIAGRQWIKVQDMLAQNSSKSYRKPRSNTALLSGVLFCGNCGSYMRPKVTGRTDKDGEPVYTYLCTLKERSCTECCNMKNSKGDILDKRIVSELCRMPIDKYEYARLLEDHKKEFKREFTEYEDDIERMNIKYEKNENEINSLVSSLAKAAGSAAETYILRQIDELHTENKMIEYRIAEKQNSIPDCVITEAEMDEHRKILSSFEEIVDKMSIEQVRELIRTCVKKTVWNGSQAHLYMMGASERIVEDATLCENSK